MLASGRTLSCHCPVKLLAQYQLCIFVCYSVYSWTDQTFYRSCVHRQHIRLRSFASSCFTKYKMHRQRLYRLCCFEVNVGEVFVYCKQKEGRETCLQLLRTKLCFHASIPFPSIYNQSIPIYLSIDIDNRYQSITTRIYAIDCSSIININRLIDIDWY